MYGKEINKTESNDDLTRRNDSWDAIDEKAERVFWSNCRRRATDQSKKEEEII